MNQVSDRLTLRSRFRIVGGRRWILRAWIIATCIVGAVGAVLLKSAYDKFAAIETIQQYGGYVQVKYDATMSILWFKISGAHFRKADSYIGWPYWGRVYRVQTRLVNHKVVDAIARLTSVRAISCVDDPAASSKLFLQLSPLRNVEHLYLRVNGSTDDDVLLDIVAKWPRLYTLWLDGDAITDAGVRRCVEMRVLDVLHFSSEKVSDDGIRLLRRCTKLRRLYRSPSLRASEAAIQELKHALPNLDVINLN